MLKSIYGELNWIEEIIATVPEKCIQLCAMIVEKSLKFHSNRMARDQSTVRIVIENEDNADIIDIR
ncbi:MAG: hypothetical protein ACTSPI_09070 [Candidatus Heimdallarchaeaceae archaeon]